MVRGRKQLDVLRHLKGLRRQETQVGRVGFAAERVRNISRNAQNMIYMDGGSWRTKKARSTVQSPLAMLKPFHATDSEAELSEPHGPASASRKAP